MWKCWESWWLMVQWSCHILDYSFAYLLMVFACKLYSVPCWGPWTSGSRDEIHYVFARQYQILLYPTSYSINTTNARMRTKPSKMRDYRVDFSGVNSKYCFVSDIAQLRLSRWISYTPVTASLLAAFIRYSESRISRIMIHHTHHLTSFDPLQVFLSCVEPVGNHFFVFSYRKTYTRPPWMSSH